MESTERTPSSPFLPGKLSTLDSFFGLNKSKFRLYIALYDLRGVFGDATAYDQVSHGQHQKGDYQWALLVVPKEEDKDTQAYRYLMRGRLTSVSYPRMEWRPETADVPFDRRHDSLLVRVLVAKITDLDRVGQILSCFETSSSGEHRKDTTWIRELVAEFRKDKRCCSHLPKWEDIERECEDFARKANSGGIYDIPTLDMISGKDGEAGTKQPVIIDVAALRKP